MVYSSAAIAITISTASNATFGSSGESIIPLISTAIIPRVPSAITIVASDIVASNFFSVFSIMCLVRLFFI